MTQRTGGSAMPPATNTREWPFIASSGKVFP